MPGVDHGKDSGPLDPETGKQALERGVCREEPCLLLSFHFCLSFHFPGGRVRLADLGVALAP